MRIAGVEVGKVKKITLLPDTTVSTSSSAPNQSVVLTEGSRAVIRYDNLIGGRYLGLEEGVGGTEVLRPGATIPLDRTAPALDLDSLIGGFRPLFRALGSRTGQRALRPADRRVPGQGATISSFLAQTASVTNTLADRDQLIGQVIANLNIVLGRWAMRASSSTRR